MHKKQVLWRFLSRLLGGMCIYRKSQQTYTDNSPGRGEDSAFGTLASTDSFSSEQKTQSDSLQSAHLDVFGLKNKVLHDCGDGFGVTQTLSLLNQGWDHFDLCSMPLDVSVVQKSWHDVNIKRHIIPSQKFVVFFFFDLCKVKAKFSEKQQMYDMKAEKSKGYK